MGIDITANFGIGVRVYLPDFEDEDELSEELKEYLDEDEYLEDILGEEYEYGNTGNAYSGDIKTYIFITDPFTFCTNFDKLAQSLMNFG